MGDECDRNQEWQLQKRFSLLLKITIHTSIPIPGGVRTLDEVDIFEGDNFVLRMTQTYAHRFQCNFDLALYPFDTQVICLCWSFESFE